ncbi:MAG TPA: tellurite resistance TerB family protein [Rhizobiaceae bacterium]|nr:tellurite resistance TerB family protein [Rhizobiaceae bacterium]
MSDISPQDALVYIMVTMSAADRSMSDAELATIGNIVSNLPIFAGFDEDSLVDLAQDCSALLQEEDGLDTILAKVHAALPDRLYDTAYALAVEVAAVDLDVQQEELRFLQMLRDELDLDKLTIAAIERSARARYRVK